MDQVKAVMYGARTSNGGAAQSSGRVTAHTQRAGVLNLSGPARPERTLGRVFFSFAFAAGLVLLVPHRNRVIPPAGERLFRTPTHRRTRPGHRMTL